MLCIRLVYALILLFFYTRSKYLATQEYWATNFMERKRKVVPGTVGSQSVFTQRVTKTHVPII